MTRRDRSKLLGGRPASPGQFLVGGLAFLGVLLVVVQAMVWWTGREARWSVRQHHSTTAFHVAEAGVHRAVWRLRERKGDFEGALAGIVPDGYRGDQDWTDVAGGAYRVTVSSGPGDGRLAVRSSGREGFTGERRAIEAVLDKRALTGPLTVPLLTFAGGARAIWGPILSTGNLGFSGASNQLYPRKFARGAITGSGFYPTRDANPSAPNTDGLEWWSYNHPPGVPDIPTIDLDHYRQLAQSQGNYYPAPPMSRTISNLVDTDPSAVRFFEGSVRFTGIKHFRGALIVLGDLEFAGSAKSPEGLVTASPPSAAWQDYQKNTPSPGLGCAGGGGAGAADDGDYADDSGAEGDKACLDQYPGDAGLHAVEPYVIGQGCLSHSNLGGSLGVPASFQGLVYVREELKATGATAIHGAVVVAEGGSYGGGDFEVFYDPSVQPVLDDDGQVYFRVVSWREVLP